MTDDTATDDDQAPTVETVELPDMPPADDATPPPDTGRKSRRKSTSTPPAAPTRKRGPGRPPKAKRDLTAELEQFYGMLAMGLMLVSEEDAAAVMDNAEACAKSMNQLAQDNPRIHAMIENLFTASAIGAVVVAHAPIAVRIAFNHGVPMPPVLALSMGSTVATLDVPAPATTPAAPFVPPVNNGDTRNS